MGPVRPDLQTIMAHLATLALAFCALALIFVPAMSKPWYQGDGLPDCAPGKRPRTTEISPIKCSSDLTMYFNNGYPTVIMMTIMKLAKVNVYFVRTVLKARSVTRLPPTLPEEIPAGERRNPGSSASDDRKFRQFRQIFEIIQTNRQFKQFSII